MADATLQRTVDKILDQTQADIVTKLETSMSDANTTLDNSLGSLEAEYDKIISDGNKEAEKVEKQIIGSADLGARNKQLLLVEEYVEKVFQKAIEKITNIDKNQDYSKFINTLLDESTKILGTSEVTVYTNDRDQSIVKSALAQFAGSSMASETIDCIGGIKATSKDESMAHDNTINARLERMKPLIRKEIVSKFGLDN